MPSFFFLLSGIFIVTSCKSQAEAQSVQPEKSNKSQSQIIVTSKLDQFIKDNPDDGKPSVSKGTVSDGSLINGKLIPFLDDNFQYFDTISYLSGRAFVNSRVKKTLIDSYKSMAIIFPKHRFFIMESSNKCGGKLEPHKTHQNGLSVDFMMPLLKNGADFIGLDTIGTSHYFLDFDDKGKYKDDSLIQINFDIVAKHILELDKKARENGMKISKVIIKIELKDELFTSKYGEELKKSGIYIVKDLTPIINLLHDEHYHIDFEYIK